MYNYYNKDIKTEYLFMLTKKNYSMFSAADSLFKFSEGIERKYDTDIVDFDAKMLKELFGKSATSNKPFYKLRVAMLRHYFYWCKKNKMIPINDDVIVSTDYVVDEIRDKTVSNPLHLKMKLDDCQNPTCNDYLACLYKCFFWVAFSGLPVQYIANVKRSDLNLKSMKINYVDEFQLCRLAANDINHWMDITKHTSSKNDSLFGFCDTKSLCKSIKGFDCMTAKQKPDRRLQHQYRWICKSGIYYRKYQIEMTNNPIDFRRDAEIFGVGIKQGGMSDVANKLTTEYLLWKEAYSL